MRFVAGGVDGPDINDLLPGGVVEASPHKPEETQRDQNDANRLVQDASPAHLLLKHFFNLADFFLHLAGKFFAFAFTLKLGVVSDPPHLCLKVAFHFMNAALNLIRGAFLHGISPLLFICGATLRRAFQPVIRLLLGAMLKQPALVFVTRSDLRVSSIQNGAMVKTAQKGKDSGKVKPALNLLTDRLLPRLRMEAQAGLLP